MPINIQSSPKKEQGKNRTETEMGCNSSKAEPPPLENTMHHHHHADVAEFQKPKTLKEEVVLQIPGCKVHLMDQGEALELAQGHFTIMKIMEQNVALATIIKVGNSVQWPLTKDEPVVKVDALHYLFSLPVKDGGEPLSYGVTFPEQCYGNMEMLDSFLKDHSCFSGLERNKKSDLKWEEFAPRVEDYNHFLARAIAGGTGQIVKGIFLCSNAYTNQEHKKDQDFRSVCETLFDQINSTFRRFFFALPQRHRDRHTLSLPPPHPRLWPIVEDLSLVLTLPHSDQQFLLLKCRSLLRVCHQIQRRRRRGEAFAFAFAVRWEVQKGGETILNTAAEKNNGGMVTESMNHRSDATKNNATNDNLKRVRKLTNMTEKLTKSLLDGVGIMSGSVMTPVLKSQPGQAFLNMLPGEVLLASLDAVNRVFEAAEAAEKQTFSATSQAATRMVSNRFGEEAGEATEHVFATAGHAVNTAWNVSKIRKAINPASSANAAGALRNSAKNRNVIY
ncbi:hypothetical protein JHK86_044682 [Glycine max]|nr:hypothetical protein JHK86_044682 [Glycine max]